MDIRTQATPIPHKIAPRAGFTAVAKLDQQLQSGASDSMEWNRDPYKHDQVAENKSTVLRQWAIEGVGFSALGALGGSALTNFHPAGAAIGAGLGAYIAWNNTLRAETGKVEVKLDEQVHSTRFYRHPNSYAKVPGQARAEMMIDGRLGEKIHLASPSFEEMAGSVSGDLPREVKTELKDLAKQRKLVADLGERSRYGFEVLSPVDARSAAKLLANEKEVFAVSGKASDTKHTLQVTSANQRSTARAAQNGAYVERHFDYQLSPVESSTDFRQLPKGEGLPDGFHGVYKNHSTTSLVVGSDEQFGYGLAEPDRRSEFFASHRVLKDQSLDFGAPDQAKVKTTRAMNVRDLVTMGGVLAGMVAATGLAPGVPEVALMGAVVGGVAGRELGWIAQDRMPRLS